MVLISTHIIFTHVSFEQERVEFESIHELMSSGEFPYQN
jgi:hypothetical protein